MVAGLEMKIWSLHLCPQKVLGLKVPHSIKAMGCVRVRDVPHTITLGQVLRSLGLGLCMVVRPKITSLHLLVQEQGLCLRPEVSRLEGASIMRDLFHQGQIILFPPVQGQTLGEQCAVKTTCPVDKIKTLL